MIYEIVKQFIGFVVGLTCSFAFWYFLLGIRPKIEVSPMAAYDPRRGKLTIKIINRGRRQVTDIQAVLTLTEYQAVPSQKGLRMLNKRIFDLKQESLLALGSVKNVKKPWTLYPIFVFSTVVGDDLDEVLACNQPGRERRLMFTIAAADAASGTKVVKRTSYRREDIQFGRFDVGNLFKVSLTTQAPNGDVAAS